MNTNDDSGHVWVDGEGEFKALCGRLAAEPRLALDTESDGFHHYFDKLCLLQISTASEHYIVDVLALPDLEPLRPILEKRQIQKVLHAADQDLMYFRRDHCLDLAGLFDTSIAAQLAGHCRLGLASILESEFAIKLSKSNQRDDWSLRPLSAKQLDYAIADTNRLLPLADKLCQALVELGRLEWAEEEYRCLEEKQPSAEPPTDPTDLTRVKGWKELAPRGRAILKELLVARDTEAQRLDRPPFRVAGNNLLLDWATHQPATFEEARRSPGLPHQGDGRLAATLYAAVSRGLQMDAADFPQDPSRRSRRTPLLPRDAAFEKRRDSLRQWRQHKAEELKLEPGVVAPLRDLEALATDPPATAAALESMDELRRWRRREFGSEWLAVLGSGA